jgi:hypothetical protein
VRERPARYACWKGFLPLYLQALSLPHRTLKDAASAALEVETRWASRPKAGLPPPGGYKGGGGQAVGRRWKAVGSPLAGALEGRWKGVGRTIVPIMSAVPNKRSYDKHPIVFAVGSPESVRSSVWRLWVRNDDVYFGAIEALTGFKVSLHQSGVWRAAFVKSLDKDANIDRAAKKWARPSEAEPGITHALSVVISPIAPHRPFEGSSRFS